MQTIVDYTPTPEELASMEINVRWNNAEEYLQLLQQRAEIFNTSFDYERVADLRDLARIRGNTDDFRKFNRYLEEDLGDIHDRIVYE